MERSNTVAGEMRQWVEDHWDPSGDLVSWRTQLAQSGWGTPSWPKQWFGRELPASTERISREVLYEAQAVGMASGVSMYLVAPTLLEWGTDTQLQQFLLPILTGQHKWCQLFSEPFDARRAGRRRMGDLGPKGLELRRSKGRLRHLARPHGFQRLETSGNLVFLNPNETGRN